MSSLKPKQKLIVTDKRRLAVVMASGFFVAVSTALAVYINSSFVETMVSKTRVGLVYGAAYLVALVVMQYYGSLIERFKNQVVLAVVLGIQVMATILMPLAPQAWLSLLLFVLHILATTVTIINFDIYLKRITATAFTGRIRGLFWTAVNLGFVVSPFLAGSLLAGYGFSAAYLASGLAAVPAWLMMYAVYRKDISIIPYRRHEPVRKTIRRAWHNHNLRGIVSVALFLSLFYSWMVIYTPLYLLQAGFDWVQIGLIFTVMLVPFVVVEYPAGWLADRYLGETEMLTIGFVLMGAAVLALLLVSSFWAVMIVLFCSRVGASLVEIMRDTYFYKKVQISDLDMIETFRNTSSFSHIVGPMLAAGILALGFGLPAIFLLLAFIMAAATLIPMTMEDTK
ncbi:MAG: MFS transporter [Parcubacteria group bacterium]|nr:MFS transporter [Parcubacteria group bacterium]